MNPLLRIFIFSIFLSITVCNLAGCGGSDDETTDGDGDYDITDGDMTDGDGIIPADGDDEIEDTADCREDGCSLGLYCDETDGKCKECSEDRQCGEPDPLTGISPICFNGTCTDLLCSRVFSPDPPPKGADIPNIPIFPEFNNGILFEGGGPVFPIGVQPLKLSRFDDAREAGFNLVIDNANCCQTPQELDYQRQDFLAAARSADLYGGVRAVWPPEQLDSADLLPLLESFQPRSNMPALLMWMISDRATANGTTDYTERLESFVFDANKDKLFAFAEDAGAAIPAVSKANSFFIATIDPTSTNAGAEIARYLNAEPGRAVWARVPARGLSSNALVALSLASISNGATGIIFELAIDDAPTDPADLAAAEEAASFLHANRAYWLSERISGVVSLVEAKAGISLLVVNFENKATVALVSNLTNEQQDITLRLLPDEYPYCRGIRDVDQAQHLSREETIVIGVPPKGHVELQLSAAAEPEG